MMTPQERIEDYRRSREMQTIADYIRAIDAARFACYLRITHAEYANHPITLIPVRVLNRERGARHLYEAVCELWRWACMEALFGRAQ